MSVQTKIMSPGFLFLNLLFLIVHDNVDAFHVDKPTIYINFFDEIVSDNVSSKFTDKQLSTTSTPLNSSAKDIRKKLDLSPGLLKLNDENKTAPYDSMFEFDNPYKADNTEIAVNEADVDAPSTARFADMMDPDLLEPEITRMFFLKAIANLIEHIMEALFTIDETTKPNESSAFDYDLAPSRNLKKRDLPSTEISTKSSDLEHKTEPKTSSTSVENSGSTLVLEKKNAESTVSSSSSNESEILKLYEQFVENRSHTPSTPQASEHVSSHHSSHKAAIIKSHAITEGHEAMSTATVKSQHKMEVLPDGKVIHKGKLISHRKPISTDEEDVKMFHFSDESHALNDEVVDKKVLDPQEVHFYAGVHSAEDHDGYQIDEHLANEEDDDNSISISSSLIFMISTIVMIIMILVAFGVAAYYFFMKTGIQSGNQTASNLRTAVA